jgi:ATP-dependent exoDNAse (exonuclease V) beta subunit
MSAIVDARQREEALDPARSFIVQAPAGSGKTGLLIQRYLRLLAVVDRPEEILAITFTRKAAAEMRRRVLEALARAGDTAAPADDNERKTWALARAALGRDRAQGWDLRRNAARLRIQTIDSLCASLARQMPVLSRLGAAPAVVDDASDLFREAAERTLALVEKDEARSPLARLVLRHLDGDWSMVRTLVEIMLRRRDQWMRRIEGFAADDEVRASLERAFRAERARLMQRARDLMPASIEGELTQLARHAAACIDDADSPIRCLAELQGYPPAGDEGAAAWSALAEMLLKKEGEWRETVNKNQGFPPAGAQEKQRKEAMVRLLKEGLQPLPAAAEALHAIRKGPPAAFTQEQWEVLAALVEVLRDAVDNLKDVFAERGEIDFSGVAQAAVEALGEEEAPTDLLLAMDVRVQHLLVDEFQDTSLTQWELLKRLTAGWTPGDGRTVFLVGDPMQSIYRFREAEVALFLRARKAGLPSVPLDTLTLRTNFRSQSGIVEWVNQTFGHVMPAIEDADAGAVPYSPSSPHHAGLPGHAVQWHAFTGADAEAGHEAEAQRVAELARDAEEGSVAILVRARAHLDRIVPALKAAGVRFRAVDIEPLGRRPVVQDLLAVTRALSHLADRIAWLALLRGPWCALSMADMHVLLEGAADATVWELLAGQERMAALSSQGAARAARTREVLRPFVAGRGRGPLRSRVEAAWLALGGPACVERASDLEDAETFFDRLEELDEAGELVDPMLLADHLTQLFAAPDAGEEARVQVMTIHRAKGLEFDTVIVPGTERVPRVSDKPLFGWRARADGSLMMAPVRRAGELDEPAYDYLRRLEIDAGDHELERLFYVAATRARKRLHLTGFVRIQPSGEFYPPNATKSLLGRVWEPFARPLFERATPLGEDAASRDFYRQALRTLDLSTLEVSVSAPPAPPPAPPSPDVPLRFDWAGETARHVGTVTHRWLQRIGIEGVEGWDKERVEGLAATIERDLERRGIPREERGGAAKRVTQALSGAIEGERGRWVLTSHPESRFEYRIRVATAEGVRLMVIDRLFTEASGRRWIVDYKTSSHLGGGLEAFLDSELERYAPQLTRYLAAFPQGRLTAALYFPLVGGWREMLAAIIEVR